MTAHAERIDNMRRLYSPDPFENRTASLPGSAEQDSPSLAGWRSAALLGRLGTNTMTKYADLLRDPRWQKKRLKKLEDADWMCQPCHDESSMLSVHHKRYVKGRMPWEYDDIELVVLCQPRHDQTHVAKDIQSALLARLDVDGPMGIDDFFAYGAGAVADWMADAELLTLLAKVEKSAPCQFAAGRFVRNLSMFGIGTDAFQKMSGMLDTDGLDGAFFSDLMELFRKHDIRLLGQGRD
jgi:hypothetical protein